MKDLLFIFTFHYGLIKTYMNWHCFLNQKKYLHSTMVLLKLDGGLIIIKNNEDLHSTMVLLKHDIYIADLKQI